MRFQQMPLLPSNCAGITFTPRYVCLSSRPLAAYSHPSAPLRNSCRMRSITALCHCLFCMKRDCWPHREDFLQTQIFIISCLWQTAVIKGENNQTKYRLSCSSNDLAHIFMASIWTPEQFIFAHFIFHFWLSLDLHVRSLTVSPSLMKDPRRRAPIRHRRWVVEAITTASGLWW